MSEILKKENIYLNCELKDKEAVIRRIGEIFAKDGYATDQYTRAMLEKEKVFNTAIGSSLAIPHGIESMKDQVLKSGIVVMTFPQGLAWESKRSSNWSLGSPPEETSTLISCPISQRTARAKRRRRRSSAAPGRKFTSFLRASEGSMRGSHSISGERRREQ